jgi:hypothetical protein
MMARTSNGLGAVLIALCLLDGASAIGARQQARSRALTQLRGEQQVRLPALSARRAPSGLSGLVPDGTSARPRRDLRPRGCWAWRCPMARLSSSPPQPEVRKYSCDAVGQVPEAERCSFVRESCPAGAPAALLHTLQCAASPDRSTASSAASRHIVPLPDAPSTHALPPGPRTRTESKIDYSEVYYCRAAPRGAFLKLLFVTFVLLVLPLLFCLLGDTTEFYFAPIMALVSQSVPKMRPRFAGVGGPTPLRDQVPTLLCAAWPGPIRSRPSPPVWVPAPRRPQQARLGPSIRRRHLCGPGQRRA